MSKLDTKKLIGAFVIVLAICILMLCVVDIFNKMDYINEYNQCIEISSQTHPSNLELLNSCKESASEGLSIRIRTNQVQISTTQYIYVYLMLIIKALLAVVFLIFGKLVYNPKKGHNKIIPKKVNTIKQTKKKTVRTKRKK
jgi:CDP-diglyceride synthetase